METSKRFRDPCERPQQQELDFSYSTWIYMVQRHKEASFEKHVYQMKTQEPIWKCAICHYICIQMHVDRPLYQKETTSSPSSLLLPFWRMYISFYIHLHRKQHYYGPPHSTLSLSHKLLFLEWLLFMLSLGVCMNVCVRSCTPHLYTQNVH